MFDGFLERRGAYARCYVSIWPYALLTHILLQIIAFIVGFVLQSLQATFAIFGASTLVLALVSPEIFLSTPALHSDVSHNFPYPTRYLVPQVVIPPWPIFNRHPVKWLPTIDSGLETKKIR